MEQKNRFIDNGNGTVTDTSTGFMWEQSLEISRIKWDDARKYASELTIGGHVDWRLPTIDELLTLIDRRYIDQAISQEASGIFVGVQSSYYWSSTTYVVNTSGAWGVAFYNGGVDYYDKSSAFYVWCVRG